MSGSVSGEMPQIDLMDFAADDQYYFDRKVGQYRSRATNAVLPREAVFEFTRATIDTQKAKLVDLAEQLGTGRLSLLQFQLQAGDVLRRIHVQSAILGRGGIDLMKPGDWLRVGRELVKQYYAGRDSETGKRFGLKHLASDIKKGLVSLPQLRHTMTQFANSGKASFWVAHTATEKERGNGYAIRVLSAEAEHCRDCPKLAALLPLPIDQIVQPTQGCECRTNCKCSLQTMTLEAALARGMKR